MSRIRPDLFREDLFVIYNNSSGACPLWWRAKASGYTNNLVQAGVYSREDAERLAANRPTIDRAMPLNQAWHTSGGQEDGQVVADVIAALPLTPS